MICLHCKERSATRPRGLCYTCYDLLPGVREQHPITSKFAKRGEGADFNGGYQLPAHATSARPGSPEKERVLIQRLKDRVSLFHPEDGPQDVEDGR